MFQQAVFNKLLQNGEISILPTKAELVLNINECFKLNLRLESKGCIKILHVLLFNNLTDETIEIKLGDNTFLDELLSNGKFNQLQNEPVTNRTLEYKKIKKEYNIKNRMYLENNIFWIIDEFLAEYNSNEWIIRYNKEDILNKIDRCLKNLKLKSPLCFYLYFNDADTKHTTM